MEDIRSVLSQFNAKKDAKEKEVQKSATGPGINASLSEIPDIFFDIILQKFKLSRPEIVLLMHLYRQVWCRPNMYRSHGIGPLNSYADLALMLHVNHDELVHLLRALESWGFIQTVRSGQYFVRKFFTEELDRQYGQDYDEFF